MLPNIQQKIGLGSQTQNCSLLSISPSHNTQCFGLACVTVAGSLASVMLFRLLMLEPKHIRNFRHNFSWGFGRVGFLGLMIRCCPSTVSRTVWKRKRVNFQRIFLVSPIEKERRHAFVRVQIEYGFGCFQVQFGLVVSTVWIGSEYGFVTS